MRSSTRSYRVSAAPTLGFVENESTRRIVAGISDDKPKIAFMENMALMSLHGAL